MHPPIQSGAVDPPIQIIWGHGGKRTSMRHQSTRRLTGQASGEGVATDVMPPRSYERQLAQAIRGLVEDAYRRGRADALAEEVNGPDRLLSVHMAADVLGVSRKRVYELMAAGRLERVELGERTLRTTERSVRALVESARVTARDRQAISAREG